MPINWRELEAKWRKRWDEDRVYEADPALGKPKFFLTVAYPYPNSPQHIGHGRTYTLADVHARYRRMLGYNVLLPMAFHYTGTPILAMMKRLQEGDQELMDTFIRIYRVSPETIKSFNEPINIARYFHNEIREGMREIGYSIDWRREFTTIDPHYNRFIEWQFQKLKEKGYISQGSHPVGWCPNDGNPVGQHDTIGDVEPEIGEFVLLKFSLDDSFLPTATLRAETVFGVTNLWIRPDASYVKAEVDGEKWIVSRECAVKLGRLNRKVKVLENLRGTQLIGRNVENPAMATKAPIFPAAFVDPNNATGVVMSVPGHAPYDYQALADLKKRPGELKEYGITPETVKSIEPVSIIEVRGYSELPARDAVVKLGIMDQKDPRLEEATKDVYSHEFHFGKMKGNTGEYAGLSVGKARDKVREDFISLGKADAMYEIINKPVTCRCGTECVVKIFENQWFINYGDPAWKALAHRCVDQMSILPEEMRQEFKYTIDWLREKACARKSGLGTKLPWDKEWIIESLSDSVIYMAYYVLAKYVNEFKPKPEQLTSTFFDYVFLGVGNAEEVAHSTRLDPKLIRSIREEFTYFYPLDSRHSGRDLVPNHLTFFIFNHVGIFPYELWPRQIIVNGSVLMEGKKMSKSFGNIIPLREAIATFGADPLRLAILSTAELMQDADFSPSLAKSLHEKLERLYGQALETVKMGLQSELGEETLPDRWLMSRLYGTIEAARNAMDRLRVREAINHVLFILDLDLQWYMRRVAGGDSESRKKMITRVLNTVLEARVRMLAPFAPYLAEELWEKLGKAGLASLQRWPEPDTTQIDVVAEESEEVVKRTLEDCSDIIKVTGIKPKRIVYYTAAEWKWKSYRKALESEKLEVGSLIKELMSDPSLKPKGKELANFSQRIVEEVSRMPQEMRRRRRMIRDSDEFHALESAMALYKEELKVRVELYREDDPSKNDPKNRAKLAHPFRPAIFVE